MFLFLYTIRFQRIKLRGKNYFLLICIHYDLMHFYYVKIIIIQQMKIVKTTNSNFEKTGPCRRVCILMTILLDYQINRPRETV